MIGQINDRLISKKKSNKEQGLSLIKRNQIEMNRTNYGYDESQFPLLSNKNPRNIIEHLDSRNLSILQEVHGVGGFNVIFHDRDPKMIDSIKQHREWYPYTLDLTTHTIYFYDAQASDINETSFEIDILLLREEIETLHKNVLDFASCIDFSF